MCSLVPLVKHYFVTMEEDDNQFKITCQSSNGFVTCSGSSGELLYIEFLHYGMCTIGIYPEDIVSEISTFSGFPETKFNTCIRSF